jgi:hypothetical protein
MLGGANDFGPHIRQDLNVNTSLNIPEALTHPLTTN